MAKISIVVPVYNVEQFLPDCINSILNQTFTDFQLILVNDGSTDGSGKICDEYAALDKRIYVVHKTNAGLSHTRNVGIDIATSKYILFVDSDDHIDINTLKDSYELAERHEADMVIYGYYADIERLGKVICSTENRAENMILMSKDDISQHLIDLKRNFVFDACWNKLYKLNPIKKHKIKMPIGEVFEDTAFNLNLLQHISRIVIKNKCYYHYIQRDVARITNTYNPNKLVYLKKRHLAFIDYLKECPHVNPEHIKKANYLFVKYVYSCFIDLFIPAAGFTIAQRREFIKLNINDELFLKSMDSISGFTRLDSIVISVSKTYNTNLIYALSKCLYLLKFKYKKLFFRLKG